MLAAMQLWYAPTSPFARKVRIAILELGLEDQVEGIAVNPWTNGQLRRVNPLAKVPALVRANGSVLFESSVICDYLDSLDGVRRLFPPDGEARWQALLLQGLADGANTAAGRLFADERRSENERSAAMMQRFHQAIDATLDDLAARDLDGGGFDIGGISAATFLAYLDFRWPGHPWREGRRQLDIWFTQISDRRSMRETAYRL